MICFIRGTMPDIASYYSSCLGVSRIPDNEPKYDSDKLKRQLDELEEKVKKQDCILSGGSYYRGSCIPHF